MGTQKSGLKIWQIPKFPKSDGFIMTSHQITDVVATLSTAMAFFTIYPLVMTNIAMDNGP